MCACVGAGNYDEAHKVKRKADQLERWERLKMDNQHKTLVAQKELQLRQQQQTQLEALKRRIQDGEVILKHVPDTQMPADFLTKWIPAAKLEQSLRYACNAHERRGLSLPKEV